MAKYLNDLKSTELTEIKRLAELFFTPEEISIMLEFNKEDFVFSCSLEGSDIYKAYLGGFLQGQIDVRTGIVKMAKAGSSPAQTMALDLINKSKIKMINT